MPESSASQPLPAGAVVSSEGTVQMKVGSLSDRRVAAWLMVVGAVITWLRIPAAGRLTFFAEDGSTFVADWLDNDGALFRPYAGYQHLVPRIAAWIAVRLTPVDWWANAVTVLACLLVGGIAALVFLFSRDVIDAPVARIGVAVIPLLIPLAGREAAGNLANLHWYVLYLVPWLLLAAPRTRVATFWMTAVAAAAALTEPQALIFAPLAVWRMVTDRSVRPIGLGFLVGIAVQLITYLTNDRGQIQSGIPPITSIAAGYGINVAASAVVPENVGALFAHVGWWGVALCVALLLAAGAYAFIYGSKAVRTAVLVMLAGSIIAWTFAYGFNNASDYYYGRMSPDQLADPPLVRWGNAASMMLVSLVPLAAGVVSERHPVRGPLLGVGMMAVLVGLMAAGFTSPTNPRIAPPWSGEVAAARESCAAGAEQVTIPVPPLDWPVNLDCSLLR